MNKKFFPELARRLRQEGVATGPVEKDRLPVLLNGQEVMWVEPQGYIVFVAGATDDPQANQIYCTIRDSSVLVNEYTRAMASAPVLEAVGLHEEFRLLAEYDGVVLAGQELEGDWGYKFATWRRSLDGAGLDHGNYFHNDYEAAKLDFACRSGLVQYTRQFTDGQLTELYRCIHETLESGYSTDCCYVAGDVLNYSQLGRFYAENGFVPEVENLSDEAFDLLDFEQIGRKMNSGEDGAFVERGFDEPGGYVVRHEDLRQAPPIPTGPPQRPDYIFRLNLRLSPAFPAPPDGKKLVQVDLPTTENQIMAALDTLGASSLDDTVSAILDGPLPVLRSEVFAGNEILLVNELADRIRNMGDKELDILKAVMEEVGFDTLDNVIELAGRTDEYIFEPGIRSVEQAAEAELNAMLGEKDAGLITQHLNLYAYGKALLEQENAAITPYGRLERRDGQPIMAMEQESGMGGMEGIK